MQARLRGFGNGDFDGWDDKQQELCLKIREMSLRITILQVKRGNTDSWGVVAGCKPSGSWKTSSKEPHGQLHMDVKHQGSEVLVTSNFRASTLIPCCPNIKKLGILRRVIPESHPTVGCKKSLHPPWQPRCTTLIEKCLPCCLFLKKTLYFCSYSRCLELN